MNVRSEARRLRQDGKSYNEINGLLNIPKSTLSSWFGTLKMSVKAHARLEGRVKKGMRTGLIRRNKGQTAAAIARTQQIRKAARTELQAFIDRKHLCAALYWAEGYKRPRTIADRTLTSHPIAFTNSDPDMVKIFTDCLRHEMCIDARQIKAQIRLFPGIDEEKAIAYWSKITKIPKSNFSSPTFVVSKSSARLKKNHVLPNGTIQIRACNTDAFYRLMGWIDQIKHTLAH